MGIEECKQSDGTYLSEDGVSYASAESFIQGDILGFCDCGGPEANLLLIRDFLRIKRDSD